MTDLVPIRRALISVSDKTGLAEFATALVDEFRVELISTGGTAKFLRDLNLPVQDVSDVTGFPEMMDGRVKTLHPKIHGGLLALRDHSDHVASMQAHDIAPIDLVVINLYPFAQTIAKPGVSFEEAIENIDIGGPSMIRSAAKNHGWVLVVTSPGRYEKVLGDLRQHGGSSCAKHRLKQAQSAFAHTAEYDGLIAKYLAKHITPEVEPLSPSPGTPGEGRSEGDFERRTVSASPENHPHPSPLPTYRERGQDLSLTLTAKQSLRYGENPHQSAALYVDKQPAEASVAYATQLHGKELSYINLLDADGALSAVKEFSTPAACIVKHTTPCGCATAATIAEAFTRAFAGDPLAAFGGIVAMNRAVDLSAAQAITAIDKLLEVIVAPAFDDGALAMLKDRWKNCRLLAVGPIDTFDPSEFHLHRIVGGYLVQQRDLTGDDDSNWRVASTRQPTAEEMLDLKFAWKVCKHVKSNAIVIAKNQMLLGAGAGQMDRPSAARLAIAKAGDRGRGGVAASDAFFPFPDGPELLLDAGVTAIIHPGGSLKDQLTIDLANGRGAAVVLTGERHFKH